jgi:hypothetical protein
MFLAMPLAVRHPIQPQPSFKDGTLGVNRNQDGPGQGFASLAAGSCDPALRRLSGKPHAGSEGT